MLSPLIVNSHAFNIMISFRIDIHLYVIPDFLPGGSESRGVYN